MNQKILLTWALAATASALIAIGFALGRLGTGPEPGPGLALAGDTTQATESNDASVLPVDPYEVPNAFVGIPVEWRTAFEGQYQGYAILFDVDRREAIVEQCFHPGHFDERKGRPIPDGWEFCEPVLYSQLLEFGDGMVLARDRRRGRIELELALSRDSEPPRLSLAFDGHDMSLIPGSKNDLYQAMDRSPEIAAQREKVFRTILTEEAARRRLAEEGIEAGPDPVTVHTLPESVLEKHRAIEKQRMREHAAESPPAEQPEAPRPVVEPPPPDEEPTE